MNIVHDMLSHLYHIYELMVDLADVGHSGAARKRVYVILVTKQYRIIADPRHIYKEVVTSIRQRFTTRPRDYLTASALEIRCEAMEQARVSDAYVCRSDLKAVSSGLLQKPAPKPLNRCGFQAILLEAFELEN